MVRSIPLVPDKVLTEIAQKRADYLCENNLFTHKGWTKHDSKYAYRGENLYKGNETIKDINKRFLESPTHKAIMVNGVYQYIGIATKCDILVEEFGGL